MGNPGSDIEAYFCQTDYLCALYGISPEKAEEWRQKAAEQVKKARATFLEKRKNVVRAVWPNGGSPDAEAMWDQAGGSSPKTVKGKRHHAALKPIVKADGHDASLLHKFSIPTGFTIAPELKALIEEAISSDLPNESNFEE